MCFSVRMLISKDALIAKKAELAANGAILLAHERKKHRKPRAHDVTFHFFDTARIRTVPVGGTVLSHPSCQTPCRTPTTRLPPFPLFLLRLQPHQVS